MKKISTFLIIALLISITPQLAEANVNISSETVKVIPYNLTKNGQVLEAGIASGTIISRDGLVLTNNHVVSYGNDKNHETFSVCVLENQNKNPLCIFTASLISKDKKIDAALLKINPLDIFGNKIPTFKYKKIYTSLPKVNSKVTLIGYPDVGGDTITYTEGKISGFDEKEGVKQIKTDATISSGNSGGTAIDSQKRFIGVPSYLKSSWGTIGYIIPLYEMNPFIKKSLSLEPIQNKFANDLLISLANKKYDAEIHRSYNSDIYPYLSIDIQEPWNIEFLNKTNIILSNTVKGDPVYLTIKTEILPYMVKPDLLEYVLKKIENNKLYLTNYKREKVNSYGIDGYILSFDGYDTRQFTFIGYVENVIIQISYDLDLENLDMKNSIDKILNTISLSKSLNNTYINQKTYTQTNPNISIKTEGDFLVSPIYNSQDSSTILSIYNPNMYEQEFSIYEEELDSKYKYLTPAEILKEETWYLNTDLINKYDDIIIDGLPGYAYTYQYEGDEIGEDFKHTEITVINGDNVFRFVYEDLSNRYDENISTITDIISNFEYNGEENSMSKGKYNLPNFKTNYEDIKNHLYENEINALKNHELFVIESNLFEPNADMTRLAALQSIINSKIFIEKGKNSQKTWKETLDASSENIFRDIKNQKDNRTLNFAIENNIIKKARYFHPLWSISLSEAIYMLCKAFDLKVWSPPYDTISWETPYLYKGYELGIIPIDVTDKPLTRGQFAALLYNFISNVGGRGDL